MLQSTVLPCLISTLGVTKYAEVDIHWQASAFCSKPSFCLIHETDPRPISRFFSLQSLLHRFASHCHLLPLCFACAVRYSRRSAFSLLLRKTLSQQPNHIVNIAVSRQLSLRLSACLSNDRVIRLLVNTRLSPSFTRIRSHSHRAHSAVFRSVLLPLSSEDNNSFILVSPTLLVTYSLPESTFIINPFTYYFSSNLYLTRVHPQDLLAYTRQFVFTMLSLILS